MLGKPCESAKGISTGQRQLNFESNTAAVRLADLYASAMGSDHGAHDRETQPGAAAVSAATRVGAVERLEDALNVPFGQPWAVVGDRHPAEAIIARDCALDWCLLGRMNKRVTQEIAHH